MSPRSKKDTASSPKKHENKFNHLRPLTGDSFFLDLKKSDDLHEVKEKIVAYGGTIEEFLSKNISYFVTTEASSKQNAFPSQHNYVTKGTKIAHISNGNSQNHQLTLAKAKKLGLRILTLNKLNQWFQDFQQYTEKNAMFKRNIKFARFEDRRKEYRPEIRIFRQFPKCNTTGDVHECPFNYQQSYNLRSGMKKHSNIETCKLTHPAMQPSIIEQRSTGNDKGYCELCHSRFERRKTHLASSHHKKNITKENFKNVDNLIASGGGDFDTFLSNLKKNKLSKEIPTSDITPKSITSVKVQIGKGCYVRKRKHGSLSNQLSSESIDTQEIEVSGKRKRIELYSEKFVSVDQLHIQISTRSRDNEKLGSKFSMFPTYQSEKSDFYRLATPSKNIRGIVTRNTRSKINKGHVQGNLRRSRRLMSTKEGYQTYNLPVLVKSL